MKTKYIIFKHGSGFEVPVVFPDIIQHDKIKIHGIPVAAGFCLISDDKFICFGESTSLELQSRFDIDEKILNHFLRGE